MPVRKKLGFDIVFFTKFLMNEIKTNISRLSVFGDNFFPFKHKSIWCDKTVDNRIFLVVLLYAKKKLTVKLYPVIRYVF
jgi:hypothetical protein